ncbi:MAG: hypothetical protein IPM52_10690 [Bacteroidetes bacterium]|nr:hypothetical protein [Bacteroidota bacterium]
MKTATFLIGTMLMLSSFGLRAGNFVHNDETYIDDIPFDTRAIFDSVQASRFTAEFRPSEEPYVDDIPFDTRSIATQALSEQALNQRFRMPEEAYINDIPFNTKVIASRHMYNNGPGMSGGVIRFVFIR